MNNDGPPGTELSFDEGQYVSLGHVSDLYRLLQAIDETMPKDAVLFIEGTSISPEIADFLAAQQAPNTRKVALGTIWPVPRTFHLSLEGRNLADLRDLAERHAEPEISDHLAVYRDDELLLTAPDAGDGEVRVSRAMPAEVVEQLQFALAPWTRGQVSR